MGEMDSDGYPVEIRLFEKETKTRRGQESREMEARIYKDNEYKVLLNMTLFLRLVIGPLTPIQGFYWLIMPSHSCLFIGYLPRSSYLYLHVQENSWAVETWSAFHVKS